MDLSTFAAIPVVGKRGKGGYLASVGDCGIASTGCGSV